MRSDCSTRALRATGIQKSTKMRLHEDRLCGLRSMTSASEASTSPQLSRASELTGNPLDRLHP